jgi:multidrug transporter EmrE-like cation transporter
MNTITFYLILASVSLSVFAQILLKHGMSSTQVQQSLGNGVVESIITILTNPSVFSGLVAYVSSAGIWLVVLAKVDVSKAYPFVGLGFIGTMIFAYLFLNEPVTLMRFAGTLFVIAGVYLISMS